MQQNVKEKIHLGGLLMSLRFDVKGVVLSLLIACTATSMAQEKSQTDVNLGLPLEELLRQPIKQVPRDVEIKTASRFAQSAAQAPSTTYIITADEIAQYGFRSMADILSALPGLFTISNGADIYIGARGLGRPGDLNSRILILIDGIRMNENVYDAGLIGADFFLDVDLIERVEFTPGPGSALYGNNALLGVVNVFPKRVDKLADLQIRSSLDSNGVRQLRSSWGYRSENGWDTWLSASVSNQSKRPLLFDISRELQQPLSDRYWSKSKRVFASMNVGDWTVHAGASDMKNGAAGEQISADPYRFEQSVFSTENQFFSIAHERSLDPNWDVFFGMSVKRSVYQERSPFTNPETKNRREFVTTSLGRWSNWEMRLSTRRWNNHNVMMGLEYQNDADQRIDASVINEEPIMSFIGVNRRLGLFIQDEWQWSPTQRLLLGLRRDSSRVADTSVNPRLSWIWDTSRDSRLKVMYGSAFRAINLNEFATNNSWDVPSAKPETVQTFESIWEKTINPQLQYRVSLYTSRIKNLIEFNQVDLPVFENSQNLKSWGGELELERRWNSGARLRAALSFQHTHDSKGQDLTNSPVGLLKLIYTQPIIGDQLQWSWQTFAMSRRLTQLQELPGYALNNVNLLWRPNLKMDLSLGVYNLGNRRVYDYLRSDFAPIKKEARTVQLSVTWRVQP
jgi:iron complex outermembrane receptor protein